MPRLWGRALSDVFLPQPRLLPSCHAKKLKEWGKWMREEEAERVGKYMIRPLLSLERLPFSERDEKVSYRYGKEGRDEERMDYLDFIARVVPHIPGS